MSANSIPFTRRPDGTSARDVGVLNPFDPTRRIRAVLFDLDGTLYRQGPLRSLMALELLTLPMSGLLDAPKRLRALRAYRKTQEQLRATDTRVSATAAQLAAAARLSGLSVAEVERLVDEWMMRRPLKYLQALPRQGARAAAVVPRDVERAGRGAVGLSGRIKAPGARAVRAFRAGALHQRRRKSCALKPSPQGFLRACRAWRLAPGEVLYGRRPCRRRRRRRGRGRHAVRDHRPGCARFAAPPATSLSDHSKGLSMSLTIAA